MQEISRFLGIVIAMYYTEHDPPYFHAVYDEYDVTVNVQTGEIEGRFPKRAMRHVLEWHDLHKNELAENWELARKRLPLKPIPPLE